MDGGCDEMVLDLSTIDFQCSIFGDDKNNSIILGSDNSIFIIKLNSNSARDLFETLQDYFEE